MQCTYIIFVFAFIRCLCYQRLFIMNIRPAMSIYIFFLLQVTVVALASARLSASSRVKYQGRGHGRIFVRVVLSWFLSISLGDLAVYRVMPVQIAWISFIKRTVLHITEIQTQTPSIYIQLNIFPIGVSTSYFHFAQCLCKLCVYCQELLINVLYS